MKSRPQINIRIDNELLEKLKEKCDREKVSQTEFITKALKAALGIEGYILNSEDLDERISHQIQPLQQELDNIKAQLNSFKTTTINR